MKRASGKSRYHNILRESLEPLPVRLDDRNRNKTGFAPADIPHHTRFSRMGSADDLALDPVFQLRWRIVFGIHDRLFFAETLELRADASVGKNKKCLSPERRLLGEGQSRRGVADK